METQSLLGFWSSGHTAVSVMEQEIIFSHALCLTFPYCDPVAMATENTARQLTAVKRSLQTLPYPRH